MEMTVLRRMEGFRKYEKECGRVCMLNRVGEILINRKPFINISQAPAPRSYFRLKSQCS